MKKLIVGICLLGWMASCGGGKKNTDAQEVQMESADSIEFMTDSLGMEEIQEEPEVPASADESFADFLYNIVPFTLLYGQQEGFHRKGRMGTRPTFQSTGVLYDAL